MVFEAFTMVKMANTMVFATNTMAFEIKAMVFKTKTNEKELNAMVFKPDTMVIAAGTIVFKAFSMAKRIDTMVLVIRTMVSIMNTMVSMKNTVVSKTSLSSPLADLGITKSHSRPHVSDDSPYSEAQFKALKYRPGFPDRFGCIQDSRYFCQEFFHWYNGEHHHNGIALLTPEIVHYGKAEAVTSQRQIILTSAFDAHPERFVHGSPVPPSLPEAAWINKPKVESEKSMLAEIISISGVSADGPEIYRRSWGIVEKDICRQAAQTLGNDT
jgi:hypothetical protein